ncbi:hypothetical protein P3T35_003630 [Kitasatospora sp. GP30]|nr:hypothetical protein [Kitasatospora sp. GP30]
MQQTRCFRALPGNSGLSHSLGLFGKSVSARYQVMTVCCQPTFRFASSMTKLVWLLESSVPVNCRVTVWPA